MAQRKKKPLRPGRKPGFTDLPPNLVSSFKDIATREGGSLAGVLEDLNSKLSANYSHSNLCAMERAERSPKPALINIMLETVLPVLLDEAGLSPEKSNAILEKILINTGDS